MGSIKQILLGVVAVVGIFVAVFYSSCSRDECKATVCFAKGSRCANGICQCPIGVSGVHCENEYRAKYAGAYKGKAPADTFTNEYHSLVFATTDDTSNYNKMELLWVDSFNTQMKFEITLENTTAAGSRFKLRDTSAFGLNFSGNGTVNGYLASLNLTIEDANKNKYLYLFESYIRQ